MGKNKKAAYSKREEEKANSEVLLRLFSAGLFYILKRYGTRNRTKIFSKGRQL